MNREELISRIEKTQLKIEKINKRIQKWTAGMNDEAKTIVANCEVTYDDPKYNVVYNVFKEYKEDHEKDPTVFNPESWGKAPQFDEAFRAYRDLADTKHTLSKYETALNKLNNFDNMEKIEILWSFLQEWKEEVRDYVINGCQLLGELKDNYENSLNKFKQSKQYEDQVNSYSTYKMSQWRVQHEIESQFRKSYYALVPSLSEKFYTYKGGCDTEALDKFLDKEVRAKYQDLVARITEKAGEILDASNLYISQNGQINGIVNGTKNTVRVETISAEGPIKRFHYRLLVHVVK